jgi:hypothetical protein
MKAGNLFRAKPAGRGEITLHKLKVNNGEARAHWRFGAQNSVEHLATCWDKPVTLRNAIVALLAGFHTRPASRFSINTYAD